MITLRQVIDHVDQIKPNAYTNEQKTVWINEIEGQIQSEVFLFGVEDIVEYDWETCADHELLVRPPYHQVYFDYLCAKIDFANDEIERYQNSMQMVNESLRRFTKWYILNYRPADRRCCYESV